MSDVDLMSSRTAGMRSAKFGFHLPDRLYEAAREAARDARVPLSEWFRQVLTDRLETEGRLPEAG